jgi:hypothetical protein
MRVLYNTYMEVSKGKVKVNEIDYNYDILYKIKGHHKIHVPIKSVINLTDIQLITNKILMNYYLD